MLGSRELGKDITSKKGAPITVNFRDHYNRTRNQCFILVEYHLRLSGGGPHKNWATDLELWNVYENASYGELIENHGFLGDGAQTTLLVCKMLKSVRGGGFEAFASNYMND